jgi:hypothetical protein
VSESEREREVPVHRYRYGWYGWVWLGILGILGMGMIWYRGMEIYRYGIRLEIRDFAGWTKLPRPT